MTLTIAVVSGTLMCAYYSILCSFEISWKKEKEVYIRQKRKNIEEKEALRRLSLEVSVLFIHSLIH